MANNNEEKPAANDSSPTRQEQLEQLRKQINSAPPDQVGELYRKYVNLFLANENHPEQGVTGSDELVRLAGRIKESLRFSRNEITPEITAQQLEALLQKQESPSTDPQQKPHSAAEPVMMFNGQFVHESEDIRINGAGIDFVFKRTYKNQVTYDGPLGLNWDHSYNLWLRVANETIFRSTGDLREEDYVRHQNGDYFVPPDGQHGVIFENDTLEGDVSFIWRAPSGDRYIYQEDPSRPFLHRIKRIEDKHGNYLRFLYPDGKLRQVAINHPGRIVQFFYDDQDRITHITDYTTEFGGQGRRWIYTYDDLGDLVAVTTPKPDRYPDGLTTCYEYSSAQFTGELQHNLTQIIDPAGQLYLENEYGIEAGLLRFNRVIRQRQGNGEAFFEYDDIVQEFTHTYSDAERPVHQTTMVERNGHPVHYIYNKFGNLILREENILQEGLIRLIQWRYRYNADGALIGVLTPDGVVTQYFYGRDDYLTKPGKTDEGVRTDGELTQQERMTFGNLLAVVKRGHRYDFETLRQGSPVWGDFFPPILAPAEASDIIKKFTYEPNFQQMLISSDPRYTLSADPNSPESTRYRETLTRYEYRPQPIGPAGSPALFLSRVIYPNTHRPDGTTLTDIIQEHLEYDAKARLVRSADPEGIVTKFEYFADGIKEGYLKRKTIDPDGLAITTGYEVNEVGIPTTVIHPRAATVSDGRFRTRTDVNALNQVIRTVTSPPFSYETRSFYDRNNLLERVERDIKDENGRSLAGGVEVRRFCYDDQFNLIQESIGGSDPATHLITHHRYDESDKRIRTIRPKGNEVRWSYDERLLPVRMTRGAGSPDASTTRTGYSNDGLKDKSVDGRGNITRYEYDPFNRLVQTTDPLGNVSRLDYDKSGNLIVERFFEAQGDGTYLLLARSEYEFDELNRRIVEKANLFQAPQRATNPETDFLASPGPGDVLLTQTIYDKKGRVVTVVNANGQETVREYDALDRKTVERDALGNFTQLSYDPNSNLVRSDTHERVTDSTGATREEVFSALYECDELDRRISTTDGLGNTTRFSYDSRNSLLKQVDPLGNIKRFEYDVYGRKVTETFEQTITGLGGGSRLPDAITRSRYDANGNLVASIDAKGNRTEQAVDALDRRTTLRYSDATTQRFQYDPDDHVIVEEDNNRLRRLYTFDALDRMILMDVDRSALASGISVEGANFAQFGYDALRRVVLERNDFAETRMKVDSLGRRYEEIMSFTTLVGPPLGPLTLLREFDKLGNLIQLTYPDGRVVHYDLDRLNRVLRIENTAKGQNYPGAGTFPNTYEVIHHQYRGLRKGRTLLGNGDSTTYDYDGNSRIIQIAHTAPGESLILQHLYDAAGNMRFKNDISPLGNRGEAYKYDSFYWLTKVSETTGRQAFDPADFAPADAPKSRGQLNGQVRINAEIGPLAQSATDFTFRYDLTGNREEEREPGQPPIIYIPNILNQYLTRGAQTFSYDRDGNLNKDDDRRRYFYDYHNRLVRVHDPSTGQDTQFFYDARGRRICNSAGGQATYLVSDGQNVIEEYRAGVLVAQYINEYGLDTICQMARRESAARLGNEYWYHKDLVRSSRVLTDAAGSVSASYRYSSFGELMTSEPVLENPYRFMGRRYDVSLEAYDFRAREYVPTLGRFLQRDIIPASNLYIFVQNNPLVANDPRGRKRQLISSRDQRSRTVTAGEAGRPGPDLPKEILENPNLPFLILLYRAAGEAYYEIPSEVGPAKLHIPKTLEFTRGEIYLVRNPAEERENPLGAQLTETARDKVLDNIKDELSERIIGKSLTKGVGFFLEVGEFFTGLAEAGELRHIERTNPRRLAVLAQTKAEHAILEELALQIAKKERLDYGQVWERLLGSHGIVSEARKIQRENEEVLIEEGQLRREPSVRLAP